MSEETFLTEEGPCEWAKLVVPDIKYDDFCIDLTLPAGLAKVHADRVRGAVMAYPNREKILADALADPAPHPRGGPVKGMALPPWKVAENGDFKFKFRSDSVGGPKGGPKFDITIDIFDAKMNPWPRDVLIGNGSSVMVCYYLYPWNNATQGGIGCTLRLVAVQVIDHVPYESEVRTHGFTQQEGVDMAGHGFTPQHTPAPASVEQPYQSHTGGPVVDDIPF